MMVKKTKMLFTNTASKISFVSFTGVLVSI